MSRVITICNKIHSSKAGTFFRTDAVCFISYGSDGWCTLRQSNICNGKSRTNFGFNGKMWKKHLSMGVLFISTFEYRRVALLTIPHCSWTLKAVLEIHSTSFRNIHRTTMSFNVMENLPKKLMILGMIPPYTTHLGCDLGMMAAMKTWWSTRGWKFTAAFFGGRVFIVWYSPQGKIMTILGALDVFFFFLGLLITRRCFPNGSMHGQQRKSSILQIKKGPRLLCSTKMHLRVGIADCGLKSSWYWSN